MIILDDATAFTAAVRPHLPAMYRTAAVFGPKELADDVVQDALLRAWRHRLRFDEQRGSLASWLVAITIRQARSAFGRMRDPMLVAEGELTSSLDLAIALRTAIQRLPRGQREVVTLFYYVDLPIGTLADILGISQGTVKSTLSDARRALQESLEMVRHDRD